MNKKGFVITGLIYSVLILFLVILFGMLAIFANRRGQLNTLVKNISGQLSAIYENPIINFGNQMDTDETNNNEWNKYKYLIIEDTDKIIGNYLSAVSQKVDGGIPTLKFEKYNKTSGSYEEIVVDINSTKWSDIATNNDILKITATDATNSVTIVKKTIQFYNPINNQIYDYGTSKNVPVNRVYHKENLVLQFDGYSFKNNRQSNILEDISDKNHYINTYNFGITETSGSDGNGGIVFDGLDDEIRIWDAEQGTGIQYLEPENATIEINLKFSNQTSSTTPTTIFSKRNSLYNGYFFFIDTGSGQKILTLDWGGNSDRWGGVNSPNIIVDEDMTITVTYDNSNKKSVIYINGELKSSKSPFGTYANLDRDTDLRIGRDAVSGYFFNGVIRNFRMYNTVLTADQIKENYEIDKIRYNLQ